MKRAVGPGRSAPTAINKPKRRSQSAEGQPPRSIRIPVQRERAAFIGTVPTGSSSRSLPQPPLPSPPSTPAAYSEHSPKAARTWWWKAIPRAVVLAMNAYLLYRLYKHYRERR